VEEKPKKAEPKKETRKNKKSPFLKKHGKKTKNPKEEEEEAPVVAVAKAAPQTAAVQDRNERNDRMTG